MSATIILGPKKARQREADGPVIRHAGGPTFSPHHMESERPPRPSVRVVTALPSSPDGDARPGEMLLCGRCRPRLDQPFDFGDTFLHALKLDLDAGQAIGMNRSGYRCPRLRSFQRLDTLIEPCCKPDKSPGLQDYCQDHGERDLAIQVPAFFILSIFFCHFRHSLS